MPMKPDHIADTARRLQAIADMQPPFANLLGGRIVEVTSDRVVAELLVREELANRNGALHGGAVTAGAHKPGGTATLPNFSEGAGDATPREKNTLFPAGPPCAPPRGECFP